MDSVFYALGTPILKKICERLLLYIKSCGFNFFLHYFAGPPKVL